MRASACGSCCSAGRYSLWMIDGGTFQVGLTVMNFIAALSSGVGRFGLPTTTLVFQTSLPSRTTRSVKSGMLTITWVLPRSRGIQRQRSMLAMMMSTVFVALGPVDARRASPR